MAEYKHGERRVENPKGSECLLHLKTPFNEDTLPMTPEGEIFRYSQILFKAFPPILLGAP